MKKILLILFLSLASISLAQTKDTTSYSEYKEYKVCPNCGQDEWKNARDESYGIPASPRKKRQRGNGFFAQQGRNILYGVTAVVISILTIRIYNAAAHEANR